MIPAPFPLWNRTAPPGTPMGFGASQNRIAIPVWSYAFEVVPPKRVIELGSHSGGFITALAVHAHNIGATCYGCDHCFLPNNDYALLAAVLGVRWFSNFDLKDPHNIEIIKTLINEPGTTYVLCDNGNKVDEFNTFAPSLKPGDIIGGHDYKVDESYWGWGEITPEHVSASVTACGLEPFQQDAFDLAAWLVYRKPPLPLPHIPPEP